MQEPNSKSDEGKVARRQSNDPQDTEILGRARSGESAIERNTERNMNTEGPIVPPMPKCRNEYTGEQAQQVGGANLRIRPGEFDGEQNERARGDHGAKGRSK